MLHSTFVNIVNFFYPIGNTAAICLTEDLAWEQDADILLLGCGDVRNILFTVFSDANLGRGRLDITCCDSDPAVIARNILLLTLLSHQEANVDSNDIWSLYYHFYIDNHCYEVIRSHSLDLLAVSISLDTWYNSKYGRRFHFCDKATLEKVRQGWTFYTAANEEVEQQESIFRENMRNVLETKKNVLGQGLITTAVRSAAPLGLAALKEAPGLYEHFWKHGTTDQGAEKLCKATKINPLFASMVNVTSMVHYGTDPILGFHLALAFAPISARPAELSAPVKDASDSPVVAAAKIEFQAWCTAFRRCPQNKCTLRFFAGDALALCLTLQGRESQSSKFPLEQYNGNWCFQSVKLDTGEYSSVKSAPTIFDVIDTSNLIDHLGPLNVLVGASPLLKHLSPSTLYTEMLVQQDGDLFDAMNTLLCGSVATIASLFGLCPPEYWTNVSATAAMDEGVFQTVKHAIDKGSSVLGQLRSRVPWKRTCSVVTGTPHSHALGFEEPELAQLLYEMYLKMFPQEDLQRLLQNLGLLVVKVDSNAHYHRASFAAMLRCIKEQVDIDWAIMMKNLLNLIEADHHLALGKHFIQEFYVYLHLFNLYTVDTLKPEFQETWPQNSLSTLSQWKSQPLVVCITMKVPRANLDVFSQIPVPKLGTPSLSCTIRSSASAPCGAWQNMFAVLQVGFGRVSASELKHDDSFMLKIVEDSDGWAGRSCLMVSFLAPRWMLQLEPEKARISLEIQSNLQTVSMFSSLLGVNLILFETFLGDSEHIFLTKHRPHVVDTAITATPCGSPNTKVPSAQSHFEKNIIADLKRNPKRVVSLRCRINFVSAKARSLLTAGATVNLSQRHPMVLNITFGQHALQCDIEVPLAVSVKRSTVRVARKSFYVEVITPTIDQLDRCTTPAFMFPLLTHRLPNGRHFPVSWNMPRVDLDRLPTLDLQKKPDMQWLITHTSLMFSSRESYIRETSINGRDDISRLKDDRVDFKDGLFSMFMNFSGLQGEHARAFALHKANRGGGHILIFISSLKLDLARHSVVLDAAVLPLTDSLMREKKIGQFLGSFQGHERLCAIAVSDDELRLWKQNFPAFTERCRTWSHDSGTCDYLRTPEIPPPTSLDDGQTPLCSCGCGHLPPEYLQEWKIPHLNSVIRKYATRAAIPPCFAVPYVENCFDRNFKEAAKKQESAKPNKIESGNSKRPCEACAADESDQQFMVCGRCRSVRYCSKACQKSNWKVHKGSCKTGP